MIDTHSHLLPGVDHGSPDLETSVSMAREAAQSGVRTVVCTPHAQEYEVDEIERVREVTQQMRGEIAAAGIDLELRAGFEVDLHVVASSDRETLETLTVEGSRALVLEMPYHGWPPLFEETLFRVATWDLRPVIAHPERNDRIQKDPELLDGCLRAGAVAQATAASLTGEFGRAPVEAFDSLLKRGAISLMATDAHAYRIDGWTLTPVLESLRGTVSDDELNLLVQENPRRLLAGETLLRMNKARRRTFRYRASRRA